MVTMLTARAFGQEVVQYVTKPYFENVEKLSVDRHDVRKLVDNGPFLGVPPCARRPIIIEQVIFRHSDVAAHSPSINDLKFQLHGSRIESATALSTEGFGPVREMKSMGA
jgi:hypothetical protein